WRLIAKELPGRTQKDCYSRWWFWRSTLMPGIRRGSWTEDEDELLREAVHRHGREWVKVAALVPGRSPRQCNSRWDITLNPDVRHTSWTLEEEERLLTAVQGRATDSSNF
ncbi:Homeodomain-like protein, partial [Thamnocephalis sphaerospora]